MRKQRRGTRGEGTQTPFEEQEVKRRRNVGVNEAAASALAAKVMTTNSETEFIGNNKALVGTITECSRDGKGRLVHCAKDGARYIIRFLRGPSTFKIGDLVWFDVGTQKENDPRNPLAINVTNYVCSDFNVES